MDEFGWSEHDAVLYLGICMGCGGVVALATFLMVPHLARHIDERLLLIFGGIIPMIMGHCLMLPWPGNDHPPTEPEFNIVLPPMDEVDARDTRVECDEEDTHYCSHDWCEDQPALYKSQFFIAFFINFFSYPFCVAICQSLYSKAIGPRPQGIWMGYLTASGSAARALGPIMVSYVYDSSGVYYTFGAIILTMVASLLITTLLYKRMVPIKLVIDPVDGQQSTHSTSKVELYNISDFIEKEKR